MDKTKFIESLKADILAFKLKNKMAEKVKIVCDQCETFTDIAAFEKDHEEAKKACWDMNIFGAGLMTVVDNLKDSGFFNDDEYKEINLFMGQEFNSKIFEPLKMASLCATVHRGRIEGTCN